MKKGQDSRPGPVSVKGRLALGNLVADDATDSGAGNRRTRATNGGADEAAGHGATDGADGLAVHGGAATQAQEGNSQNGRGDELGLHVDTFQFESFAAAGGAANLCK